jgi:integrase
VHTYATWRVMRRLRRHAEARSAPRTYTGHAKNKVKAAADFLTWLAARNTALADCRQADIDEWIATRPTACHVRDFTTWAAEHRHCDQFTVPGPERHTGTATDPDRRWALLARLLHDDRLDVVDRVAGCLVLLFGQQQSRIAAMTTSQVSHRDGEVFVRFSRHEVPVPEPLGALLLRLLAHGKSHTGIGSPPQTRWLFPGGMPGRPITASRLADRLRTLGIPSQAARRATLLDLAAQLPAAVLADLVNLHPTTAARWMHQAGGDWTRYAAELARTRNHQPCE